MDVQYIRAVEWAHSLRSLGKELVECKKTRGKAEASSIHLNASIQLYRLSKALNKELALHT